MEEKKAGLGREQLAGYAVSVKASADPTESSRAAVVLQNCVEGPDLCPVLTSHWVWLSQEWGVLLAEMTLKLRTAC